MNNLPPGMVVGIGLDLAEVSQVAGALERHGDRFIHRVFTEHERQYCGVKNVPAQFYAARFAAKEAVAKAFGTGIGAELGWQDMEVTHAASGAPEMRLLGKGIELAARRGVGTILLSLTHTPLMAAASVVLIAG